MNTKMVATVASIIGIGLSFLELFACVWIAFYSSDRYREMPDEKYEFVLQAEDPEDDQIVAEEPSSAKTAEKDLINYSKA